MLDSIDPSDLERRLGAPDLRLYPAWSYDPKAADEAHETEWVVASGREPLRELAVVGYRLFNKLFPAGTQRRSVLDQLEAGSLIPISWTVSTPDGIGGVPWLLLYMDDAPGQRADRPNGLLRPTLPD